MVFVLLYFLMASMLSAKRTKFFELNSFRVQFFVFVRRVITASASGALELNKFSQRLPQYLRDDSGADGAATLPDGEAKFLLHGDGGDEFGRDGD